MLVDTMILPSAIDVAASGAANENLLCSAGITLMSDVAKCGSVLVDNANITIGALGDAIDRWPMKFKIRGQALMARLQQTHRFIPVKSQYQASIICAPLACKDCVGIATVLSTHGIVCGGACVNCFAVQAPQSTVICITEYSASSLFELLRDKTSFALQNGEWKRGDLDRKLFDPVLKRAKHVKIVDRYIGRSIDPAGLVTEMKDCYQQTLEWIFKIYLRRNRTTGIDVFEIYCGIDTRHLANSQVLEIVRALRTFESAMNTRYPFSLKLIIKKEGHAAQMAHARYLITDQTSILIERGFDLFWNDGEMRAARMNPAVDDRPIRDVSIAFCADAGKIEAQFRRLPSL
jgi:hypothetical protein